MLCFSWKGGIFLKKTILLLCIVCLLLAGCSPFDQQMDKDTIFTRVEENRELILFCIEKNDFSLLSGKFPAAGISVEEHHVDFDCGAAGFGSETAYRGFYYSEEEDPYAPWCAPPPEQPLTTRGGGFFWEETQGDNTYYVEKICEGFFYYEGTF